MLSVFMLEERRSGDGSSEDAARLEPRPTEDIAELYCAPRKALFEEMLWDSAEAAAQDHTQRPRERLELSDQGITYVPVTE